MLSFSKCEVEVKGRGWWDDSFSSKMNKLWHACLIDEGDRPGFGKVLRA
jgi:hypothetical protein